MQGVLTLLLSNYGTKKHDQMVRHPETFIRQFRHLSEALSKATTKENVIFTAHVH